MALNIPGVSFGATGLKGTNISNPTAIDFSKTGNPVLFVTQQNGEIWRLEILRSPDGADGDALPDFFVTSALKIGDIATGTQGYNDDGTFYAASNRQTTGLVTDKDADGNDVLYVNSSDDRIAVGNDSNLDTNSSQIHRLVLDAETGEVLSNVALVRGLPRSEENHSVNGLEISVDPETGARTLWAAVGGNTNNGAPGNNFAGTVDFPYSGTLIKIDLDALEAMDVRVDGAGDAFVLDLPTLDHPGRANVDLATLDILNPEDAPNFSLDNNGTGANGALLPDWAGGANGLNAAKVVDKVLVSQGGQLQFVDNPLAIHSPGYRNPYDVVVTEAGEVFTWDNGPNTGWGGRPKPFEDATPGGSVNYVEDWTQELATNEFNESGSTGFGDQLHYTGNIDDAFGPYGGFPVAIRAAAAALAAAFDTDGSYKPGTDVNGVSNPVLNPDGSVLFADETEARTFLAKLLIIYEEQSNGSWVDVSGTTGLPVDLFDAVSGYDWVQPGSSIDDPTLHFDGQSLMDGTFFSPESQLFEPDEDGSLKTTPASTNGLAEYTASNFGGALQGALLAASFDGNVYFEMPVDTDGDGRTDAVQSLGTVGGFGSQPLTLVALGDAGLSPALIDNDGDGIDDFAGLIVAATYGADSVTFLVPGGGAVSPDTDLDGDGLDNTVDSHVGDPLQGLGVLVANETSEIWQFELSTPTTPPGAIPPGDSIAGDLGINAVWRDGVTPQVTSTGAGALYDPSVWNLGGASTFASLDEASAGSAVGTQNAQKNALGIGFALPADSSGATIMTELVNAFSYTPNFDAGKTWDGGEKFGLMLGPGHQSTFVEATIAVDASSGTPKYGLQLVVEENNVPVTSFIEIPGIEAPVRGLADPNAQIAIDIDLTPGSQTVAARVRYVTDGAFTDWVSTAALDLPDEVADALLGRTSQSGTATGAVASLVASVPAADDSFAASWDWVEVTGGTALELENVVVARWNAGSTTIASVDNGPDWVADTSVLVGGPTKIYTDSISSLDASVPYYTTPEAIFDQQRWDPDDGNEMSLALGTGLAYGVYAVRLFMGDGYNGTSQPGARVFDVSVEGELFLDDLDLAVENGPKVGGMFQWIGEVADGTVDIDFAHVVENPLINGVEIVRLSTLTAEPVLSALSATVSEADMSVTAVIRSNVPIPAGETVTVTYEIASLAGGATGEVDFTAPALVYDPATGLYSGSGTIGAGQTDLAIPLEILPDAQAEGAETFEIRITGVSGAGATANPQPGVITIEDFDDTGNVSPVIADVADLSVNEGALAATSVSAADADGDAVTLSLALADASGAAVTGYAFTDNGDGTGSFSWATPDVAADQVFTATLTATDGISAPATQTFTVTVADTDAPPPPAGEVLFRWNAGPDVAATDGGPGWSGDDSVQVGGPTAIFSYSSDVPNLGASVPASAPVDLFDQEMYDAATGAEMAFDFGTGLAAGDYTIRFYFSDRFSGTKAPGARVFDVAVEDQIVLDDFDIVSEFGFKTGGMVEWTGQVADGTIDIDFAHVLENPLVNAIEILGPGGGAAPSASLAPPANLEEGAAGSFALNIGAGGFAEQVTLRVALVPAGAAPATLGAGGDLAFNAAGATLWDITLPAGATAATGPLVTFEDAMAEGDETFGLQIVAGNVGAAIDPAAEQVPFSTGVLAGVLADDDTGNVSPVIADVADLSVNEGALAATSVSAADADGDAVTLSLALTNASGAAVTGYAFTDNGDGTGSFSWATPDVAADQVFTATLTATDGISAPATQTFTVTVADTDAAVGAARFSITENSNNVQISNYGQNSFLVTNTGGKTITSVVIDATTALYPDSVFDPYGLAGDTTSKALKIDTAGGTGVVAPSGSSYIGPGGIEGFHGLLLEFNPTVNGGFNPGETVGFSIDMDPNSVAGATKSTLDAGSDPDWDVGGVSGAEIIGTTYTITFADGTTATGQLAGAGNQGGARGQATQALPGGAQAPSLTVNGFTAGETGSYTDGGPGVIVSGPAGATAQIVLTRGMIQPFVNAFPDDPNNPADYHDQLDAQLAALAAAGFPANNAVEFQTVTVTLTGAEQDISDLFDFGDVALFDLPVDEAQLPLGFVATLIDPANGNLPLGPVSEPIYLQYADTGNVSPVIADVADLSVNEGALAATSVSAADADGDAVTLSLALADASGAAVTGYAFIDNGDGTGSFSWATPDVAADQVFTATLTATDGVSAPDIETFTVTVADTDAPPPPAGEVLFRWNAGPDVAATDGGPGWSGDDTVQVGGPTAIFSYKSDVPNLGASVPASAPVDLFDQEMYDAATGAEMAFDFGTGLAAGDYTIRFYFSDRFSGTKAPGARVFDVAVEDQIVLDDFDIVSEFGFKTGGMVEWTGQVTDGTIDIDFAHVLENPLVNAIEIISSDPFVA